MKKTELYWLAGYLEGEGCFGFYAVKGVLRHGTPQINIGSTDKDIIEYVAQLTRPKTIGIVNRGGNCKIFYTIFVCGEQALSLMNQLLPLMGKRRQAKIREILALAANRLGHVKGSKHYAAKLTEMDIPIIRNLHKNNVRIKDIASQFNVSWDVIYKIIKRQNWKHIA